MKQVLLAVLLFLPFIVPIVLQVFLGRRNLKHETPLKIWQITLINLVVLFVGVLLIYLRMRPATAITHDGLGYVFLIILTAFTLTVVLLVTVIQYIIFYRKRKNTTI